MKKTDPPNKREYRGRLKSSLKGTFNTQLQQLRSLKTATKKRRALKKGRNKSRIHEIGYDGLRLYSAWPRFL